MQAIPVACKDQAEWLENRRKGLGGSDIAAVAGISPFAGPIDIWQDKLGVTIPRESEPMAWGSALEQPIADRYANNHPGVELTEPGLVQHPADEWMLATPDRLVDARRGLELKTAGMHMASRWGEPPDGVIPDEYYAQVQWYMGILRSLFPEDSKAFDHAWVIGLLANRSLERRLVMFDQEYFDKALHRAKMFWQHVEDDTAPIFMDDVDDMDPSVYDSVLQAYPGKEDSEVYRFEGGDDNDLLWAYNAAKDQCKAAEQELKRIKAKIGILLGDATEGRSRDFEVSWPVIAGRGRLDADALAKAHPDIDMERFKKTGKGYRGALRITRKEGA